MSNESILKKEFKEADVSRIRNIVKKKYTDNTKTQVGYTRDIRKRKEGEVWEEGDRTWTVKNGIRQTVPKHTKAREMVRMPLCCPKCKGPLQHHLAKKMYNIHGICFECTIEHEAKLRKLGLYKQYEKRMMQGNMQTFIDDIHQWLEAEIGKSSNYVTEQGDIEEWKNNDSHKAAMIESVKNYTTRLAEHLK